MSSPTPAPFLSFSGYSSEPGQLHGIGFWPRAGARLIDMAIFYLVVYAVALGVVMAIVIASMMVGADRGVYMERIGKINAPLLDRLFTYFGMVLYFSLCEWIYGSTPGKRICGMVVVKEDGSRCTAKSAFIRAFSFIVDALVFGWVGARAMASEPVRQQRHGDSWAHTMVVHRKDLPEETLKPGWMMLPAFGSAIAAVIVVNSAFFLLMILN